MEAFYFGPSESYLFGAFHPRQGVGRNEAIVLCNPFGQEYLRAHKSIRRLAINLAELGYPVLRFDYRGTGDSAGDLDGVSADHWVSDIGHAIQELQDMAAVPKVALIGLRLGALLAAKAATEHNQVSRLVMWDPIVDGADYVDGIRSAILDAQPLGSRSRVIAPDGTLHFNGFCMPPLFQDSISNWRLEALASEIQVPVAQIMSHESDSFAELERLLSDFQGFYSKLAPAPHDWNYVDHVGGILWPKPVIDAIEQYFGQATSY
ncbi:alpha/beta fold hydrolase [Marinobacter sp. F4206]|uniref:alpha/beta fold hydrolase n=1 Tax=Marinobacter sp. F4206 TaxID=2861777 RepID=UPI001C5F8567|nr:alpha/beta fold hydrolase [Marinobacter sp. F4206]MBW4933393.1 alpha/beta fold hydrolase [Marinobacter sp. F4206]